MSETQVEADLYYVSEALMLLGGRAYSTEIVDHTGYPYHRVHKALAYMQQHRHTRSELVSPKVHGGTWMRRYHEFVE